MKVKELIEHLKKFDGDMEVYAWTDHGQTPEKVNIPEAIFVESDKAQNIWDDWAFSDDYAEDFGYTIKAVLL